MNRDNVLFTVIGLLTGFIAGYVMHEVMAEKQPTRRIHGAAAETGSGSTAETPPPPAAGAQAMEAVQRLQQRVAENPNDADALKQLALMNVRISNWSRAIELFERVVELRPDDYEAVLNLGGAHRQVGNTAGAIEQFGEAKARFPDRWEARYWEIVVLASDLGDLEAASTAMEELRALAPDNQDVERLAAEIERLKGG